MNPNILLPQLPDVTDHNALKEYLAAHQKILSDKQKDDYKEVSDIGKEVSDIGDGIIESGSNSNGKYIKFRDGTLICWGTATTPTGTISNNNIGTYGWSFYGGSVEKTLPYGFINTSYRVIASSNIWSGFVIAQHTSTSSITFYYYSQLSNYTVVDFIIIGRWKA